MPKEVNLMRINGKWHLHDNDGNCRGAFIEKADAINAAKDPLHNFLIKEEHTNV